MTRPRFDSLALVAAVWIGSLALATAAVEYLQDVVGVPNPSAVYLLAVVATALVAGTAGAILASVASFLLYNFLFTAPRFTFSVADPGVLLSVVLLLFVGIVVGQLAALQRARARDAELREREARTLFQISRRLVTRDSTIGVLPDLLRLVAAEAGMARLWLTVGPDEAAERFVADSFGDGSRPTPTGLSWVLRRTPGDAPAAWVRVHHAKRGIAAADTFRVRIEAGRGAAGSMWGLRDRAAGVPDRPSTRLLSATADQIGQAWTQDELAGATRAAEIARQSDSLKSALLQSVSHDLRTPLAAIRVAAASLRPDHDLDAEARQATTDIIEREVERLNRLVTNLLDLSRIEAGSLRPNSEVVELDDVLGRSVERLRRQLVGRSLDVELHAPPVRVDPVLLDAACANLADNAATHGGTGRVRVVATDGPPGFVRLTFEDGGPGVPERSLPRLFERFYRVPSVDGPQRAGGTGIGLAVVDGFVGAMGGHVSARRSSLGGLAIDLDLPIAAVTIPQAAT